MRSQDTTDAELRRKAEWAEQMAAQYDDPYFKMGWLDIAASYRAMLKKAGPRTEREEPSNFK